MNTSQSYKTGKNRAQAMVEFTLALPILLLLLYGVLETGRLLFVYASTISAARQAVRYGSATGIVGTVPGGYVDLPYYQYCEGIRGEAKKVGFLNKYEDANIQITYDAGINSATGASKPLDPDNPTSKPTCDSGTFTNAEKGNRVIVEVSTQWIPIVPFLPLKPLTIKSTSERTIMAAVPVSVTAMPGNTGLLLLSVTTPSTTYNAIGDVINFTFTLTNSGGATVALDGPFSIKTTINGNVTNTTCSNAPSSLGIGASFSCAETYSYTTTQNDINAGSFISSSVAYASGASSTPIQRTFTALQTPRLSLSITPSSPVGSKGTVIRFTYTLTNTGNVNLTSPFAVTVTDTTKFASVDCSNIASPLTPGASQNCLSAQYTIKEEDIIAESVVNTASATAKAGTSTITSAPASATVLTPPLILSVSPSISTASAINQLITYTYTIINNSGENINLNGIIDSKATVSNSCNNKQINHGDSLFCTGTYYVTTTDYELVSAINNTTFATALTASGQALTSSIKTTSVALTQIKGLSLTLVSVTPSHPADSMIAETTTVTYVYTLTNTGNVTLAAPFTIDNGSINACAAITSLAPLTSANCTVVYIVSQADIDAGSFTKTATASGYFNGNPLPPSAGIATQVITFSAARFTITSVSGSPNPITQAGDITYTYTILNTGGVSLSSPYTISATGTGSSTMDCANAAANLPPGASTTCISKKTISTTGTYTVTVTAATASGGTVIAILPTPNPTVTVPAYMCNIQNITLNVSPEEIKPPVLIIKLIITNNVGAPLHISSFSFNWNATASGGIDATYLKFSQGGTGIWFWSGIDSDGYYNSGPYLNSPLTINSGTTEFTMTFSKQGMQISGLKIYFVENGCGPLSYR